jgi:hypothetical protein
VGHQSTFLNSTSSVHVISARAEEERRREQGGGAHSETRRGGAWPPTGGKALRPAPARREMRFGSDQRLIVAHLTRSSLPLCSGRGRSPCAPWHGSSALSPPCLPTLAPLFPPPIPLLPHIAWALHLHPLNADQIYIVKRCGERRLRRKVSGQSGSHPRYDGDGE